MTDHLLRTLAAVSPEARVLHLNCGDGALTADIARLGFDVWACDADPKPARDALANVLGEKSAASRVQSGTPEALGFDSASFDWVAAWFPRAPTSEEFESIARVMKPGSWVWAAASGENEEALNAAASGAGLAVAERVKADVREGEAVVRGIFRRVGEGVTG